MRSLHEEQFRQNFEKKFLDPGRHDVRRRRPEVNVQDEDGHNDGTGDEHHGEEQVFADQRRGQRRRRVDLGDQQQEDVEGVEDRDAHRDLLAGVGRNVEDKECDRTDGDARQNEVDRVEQGLSSDRDVELYVWIRFRTARVELVSLLCFHCQ